MRGSKRVCRSERPDGGPRVHRYPSSHLRSSWARPPSPSLVGLRSVSAIAEAVAREVSKTPRGQWIVTTPIGEPPDSFHLPESLEEKRWPTRADLDEVAPDNPVYIPIGIWPYPVIFSAEALKRLGVTRERTTGRSCRAHRTRPVEGMRFYNRSPLWGKLQAMLPRPSPEMRREALRQAVHDNAATGVTTIFESHAALGRYRGGPAKVAVLGSALFGSISGSAVANVAITGTATIPLMKRIGYRPEVAAAVEAAASTGGLVAPPVMSVVAFLMAEYLEVSYGRVIMAAALPALLYFAAILIQVDLEAGRTGIAGMKPEDVPKLREVLRKGWAFLLPAPVLIFTLVALSWEPAKAGMFSVLVLLVTGYWFVRDKPFRW